ncbi:MAG: (p)ppGpp synthetase, partial [Treponemataceae bacterium]|nr:(p)ppGpp synthetase [Treponemataceae bacterium]
AEVEHELIYKTEFTPFDMPLRRKLASMNASLSLADIIFQEIRDYQKNLQNEMNERRRTFYEKADALTDKACVEGSCPPAISIERVNPYVKGTIDDLLLQAIRAHNSGNLSEAILIYSQIIDSKPTPNAIVLSVIYKHRGMAYFTQNDYDHALADFKESFVLDGTNFRSVYYEGIVYAIQKQHEKAVECFTKSLELNEYQSHTFYRRASAYYELKQYENAMNDVVASQRLGLDDEGLQLLHDKLVEKFDMKM